MVLILKLVKKMLRENFAERLFCDLRNHKVKIEYPFYVVEGAKIGDDGVDYQLNIFGVNNKYSFNVGVAGEIGQLTFSAAYQLMLTKLIEMENIKFFSLVIPKRGVVDTKLEEFERVVSRYIKDYLPGTDEVAERWDIMVGKVS